MPKFIVSVRVYNDRELTVWAKDEEEAAEKADARVSAWDVVDHEILDIEEE